MSTQSKIEWTDATWNPVRGCTKVSSGCKNCYAQTFAERFRGVPNHPFEFGFDLNIVPHKLTEPLHWLKPKKIFVNSMSDLFHERIPDNYIEACFEVMESANWHTYQILTKRSERMLELFRKKLKRFRQLEHIWVGVSVENKKDGLPRLNQIQKTKIAVKFLSIEPLLEDLGSLNLNSINWVIVGGESGPRARPMKREWVISIRDQCKQQQIPFFFKQWGGVIKSRHGRELDGRFYDQFPKSPTTPFDSSEMKQNRNLLENRIQAAFLSA